MPSISTPAARTRRRSRRRISITMLASAVLVAAACAPPTWSAVPPPSLPTGVGVQWLRDAGGTADPVTGFYTASMNRFVTLNGTTTGPTPAGPSWLLGTPSPLLAGALESVGFRLIPDGTARFPWNGFAGEGVTATLAPPTSPYPQYNVTFPGGSCTVGPIGAAITGIVPSPDGTRAAVSSFSNDVIGGGSITGLSIRSLVNGGCPTVSSVQYLPFGGNVDRLGSPAVVWAPDSSALLYQQTNSSTGAAAIMRLNATSGATPTTVLPATENCSLPLGWSVADRILLSCVTTTPGTPVTIASSLETMEVTGGARQVIDSLSATQHVSSSPRPFHYGYYVPGTTSIVFNDGSTTVTNSDGRSFPWFQIHLISDVPGAASGPLLGVAPPFGWHQEALSGSGLPPFTFTDVPNLEFVERFVR